MSVLQTGLAKTSAGGYEIDNSLRFNDNDSAYLSRTPSSAGNRKTWTYSAWIKVGNLGTQRSFLSTTGSTYTDLRVDSNNKLVFYIDDGSSYRLYTTQLFRDPSAWYHIVVAVDTTQATASNRVKIYVNGEQITAFDTSNYPAQNYDGTINNNIVHSIGRREQGGGHPYDGYLAEVNFVDGQALTPADFGETGDYGEWKPIEYEGTYGTNGFYLDFGNSGSLGTDSSGNSNNWTPNNLAATDQMLDSPTNNFCTLNPLDTGNTSTLSQGNLKGSSASSTNVVSSFRFPTGKSYFEINVETVDATNWTYIGIASPTSLYVYRSSDGYFYNNGSYIAYGASYTTGDIIGVAVDLDNDTLEFYKNGVSQGQRTSVSITGDSYVYCAPTTTTVTGTLVANFGQDSSFAGNKTAQGNTDGNGIGDFYYTPPTGYLALCTQNLPDPAVIPSEHFNTVLYTGTGSDQAITGVGFQPDWTWLKMRSSTGSHGLFDAVRGATKRLSSNLTAAEDTAAGVNSFDSDGFTLDALNWNDSSGTYVAWNWKANGSGVSNTDGTITSTVSANVDAGFSIVSYTGNSTNGATVGHGLSKVPELFIVKNRDDGSKNWAVYYGEATRWLKLNNTNASAPDAIWANTAPTSSVFSLNSTLTANDNGDDIIAYCFHSVDGYSKVGSYTGNGSSDGTFVHTGFRPAYVMIKKTTGTPANWHILDIQRSTYNVMNDPLFPDTSGVEAENTAVDNDFLSNGFKLRSSHPTQNGSGYSYIFLAFAENPFKHTNAR